MNKKISHLRVAMILDKRRKLKSGNYAVRTRVTIGKAQYYFVTNIESTEELFERANEPKPQKDAKKLRDEMDSIKSFAENICTNLPSFTPEAFRNAFYKEATAPTTPNNLFDTFKTYIEELETEGRYSTARSYRNAMHSISAYCHNDLSNHRKSKAGGKKKDAPNFKKKKFEEITVKWLKEYSKELKAVGTSNATIGIYCRSLRVVYNYEMKSNPSLTVLYPFGKNKFEIPTARNNKRALSISTIETILSYEPANNQEQRAKDLWVFSYLCNGMNIADVIQLKYEQLKFDADGCSIEFERKKTQRKANKTEIVIELDKEVTSIITSIIERQGNKTKEGYIFPYLNDKNTPKAQYTAKNNLLSLLNESLSHIAENLNIPTDFNLTTYTARHSYATVMLRSGVSVAEISESLGHADLKTTENYLGGFSKETKRKNSSHLLGSKTA